MNRASRSYQEGYMEGMEEEGLWTTNKQSRIEHLRGKIAGMEEKMNILKEEIMMDLLKSKVRNR